MFFPFLRYSKAYYLLSSLMAVAAVSLIFFFGLNLGIDFLGGTIIELDFSRRPENQIIQEKLADLNLGEIVIQPTGENGLILRMKEIDESTHQSVVLAKISEISDPREQRFEAIGPTIGRELSRKTAILILLSLLGLFTYIIISFRKVSRPISGFKYGIISIIALAFDVLITVGVFSLLGKLYNVQFNIPIITALLTILGYTINDKVVVFDRVRENLLRHGAENFRELVNQSLNQTFSRSLSTGFCSLLVLLAIFFLGGETLKYFALTLIVGIVAGTYSSLFLAAPLLCSWLGKRGQRL